MQQEELIRSLAEAICRELRGEIKKTLLLFARRDQQLPAELQRQINDKWRVVYYQEPDLPEAVDRYLLPCLHLDQMVDLALGKSGSRIVYAVRKVLLAGKKVEVCHWEYRQFLATIPLPLLQLYEGYCRTLNSYGVIDWQVDQAGPLRHRQSLLGEAEVLAAAKDGVREMELAAGCLVTPLARDAARELGIRLVKQERGTKR